MSTPEQLVYDYLTLDPVLGAVVFQRIYPDEAPQGTALPYVVFTRASSVPEYTLNDTLAGEQVIMRVTCWSASRLEAEQVGDDVVDALSAAHLILTQRSASLDPLTLSYAADLDFEIWN